MIAFAPFRMDLLGGRLLRGDAAIPLRPKTWSVLLYLAERPGVLITKDQLLDAVWADTAVTPDTLNKSIGELRVALGDDSHAARFIETVHRRGFRFIAPVRTAAAESHPADTAEDAFEQTEARVERTIFVGREEELQRLATCFARADAGERQIVFITGPAGIGKTALVEAFLARLEAGLEANTDGRPGPQARSPIWIGRGGCIEHHGAGEAYLPVLEALERLARRPDGDRLLKLLRHTAPLWLLQMPWLVSDPDLESLRLSLQAVRPERMLREMAGLLEAFTTDVTMVLVLEDLHWCDAATVDLLSQLGRRSDPARLLVICTYRPAEVAVSEHPLASAVRTLETHRQCATLRLADLSEDGVRSYLAARFVGDDFPPTLAALLHAHTSGDPLFLVAIVDHLLARGWILDTAPGWVLSAPPETIDLGVPDDVRQTIATQFYRVSPTERAVLEAASIAGNEMVAQLAATVLGVDVADVERICETLARTQRFLRVAGSVEWPDGSVARRYAFTHELHRQVVYDEIADERRVRLHCRIGEALEAAYGPGAVEIAPVLAIHFERGRDRARALHYLIASGKRARQRFAHREAVRYFEAALGLLALMPDDDKRRRHELDLRLLLGAVLGDIHGFAAASVSENYQRALALCASVGSAAQRFEILYALWYLHGLRAEREEALAIVSQLSDLAGELATPEHAVLLDSVQLRTALYDRRFAESSAHMESLLAKREAWAGSHAAIPYGMDPAIAATMHHAVTLWFLGDSSAARTTADAGLARARASGNFFFLSGALAQGAIVALFCRNTADGAELADQAATLSAEQGFAYWNTFALGLKGWARVQQKKAAEGIQAIEHTLALMRASGMRFFASFFVGFLAEAYLTIGAVPEGLAAVEEGLQLCATSLDRSFEPELLRLKGELLLMAMARQQTEGGKRTSTSASPSAQWQEAERCLLHALELSREAQAKSLELRAATSLARAWHEHGRAADARPLLSAACAQFSAESDSLDVIEARALLGELGMVQGTRAGSGKGSRDQGIKGSRGGRRTIPT